MRVAFHQRPDDLIAALVLSSVLVPLALFSLSGVVRVVLGFFFILLVPGYVLAAALFPKASDLGWIERLALSVGLSISLVALIGLCLNFTPWGIFLGPALASLLLFTYAVGGVAWLRRVRLPVDQRLALSLAIILPNVSSYPRADKVATIALAASLVFAAGAVAYIVVTPRPAERFTEFYMLNATGVAGGYPKNLTVKQTAMVLLTVHNVEYVATSYSIRVVQAVMEAFFNATANQTQYQIVSQTPVANLSLELANGAFWNRSYSFSFSGPGIFRLYFDLYKLPDTQNVYRYAFLTVFVRT